MLKSLNFQINWNASHINHASLEGLKNRSSGLIGYQCSGKMFFYPKNPILRKKIVKLFWDRGPPRPQMSIFPYFGHFGPFWASCWSSICFKALNNDFLVYLWSYLPISNAYTCAYSCNRYNGPGIEHEVKIFSDFGPLQPNFGFLWNNNNSTKIIISWSCYD